MQVELVAWYTGLSLVEAIGLWGSAASIVALVPLVYSVVTRIQSVISKRIMHEMRSTIANPAAASALILSVALFCYLISMFIAAHDYVRAAVIVLMVVFSIVFSASFFLTAKKESLLRSLAIDKVSEAAKISKSSCSAIKFDIDRIVAINDYSHATGDDICKLVRQVIHSREDAVRASGVMVQAIESPGSDEIIWILPNTSVEWAADTADDIRHEVKRGLPQIPYYADACAYVNKAVGNAPDAHGNIGTVSAGVAAYTRGEEALLSDISSAAKAAKLQGRNRTAIYQRDGQCVIRDS